MLVQFGAIDIHMLKEAYRKMQEINIEIYSLNLEGNKLYINGDYIVEFVDYDNGRSEIIFYSMRA